MKESLGQCISIILRYYRKVISLSLSWCDSEMDCVIPNSYSEAQVLISNLAVGLLGVMRT